MQEANTDIPGTLKKEDLSWNLEEPIRISDFSKIRHAVVTPTSAKVFVHVFEGKQVKAFSHFVDFEIKIKTLCYMDKKALTDYNVRPLNMFGHQDKKYLVCEDVGNMTLQSILDFGTQELTRPMVLDLAYHLSKALTVYAELRMANKAVHPTNIYYFNGKWMLGPPSPDYLSGGIEVDGKSMKFKPPEASSSEKIIDDSLGDIWSLGVILDYLMALTRAKEDKQESLTIETEEKSFFKSLIMSRRRSSQSNQPPLNVTLLDIVSFCTQENPANRWKAESISRSSVLTLLPSCSLDKGVPKTIRFAPLVQNLSL